MPPKKPYPEDVNRAYMEAVVARYQARRERERQKERASRLRFRSAETLERVERLLEEIRWERRKKELDERWRNRTSNEEF